MVDFIFGVSHPGHWHALNMHQNPHHYSSMRFLGSGAVSLLQEKVGAGIYFNPYVQVNGMVRNSCEGGFFFFFVTFFLGRISNMVLFLLTLCVKI